MGHGENTQALKPAALTVAAPANQEGLGFGAFRYPDFRAYFTGYALTMMGDNIEHVISYWIIFKAFDSPILAGFAVIAHWLPYLLFSVYFGSLADRWDCRRLIQGSQVLFAAASLAWGALFLTDSLEVWHAVVLLLVHGLAGAVAGPASQLIIYDIVGRQHLQSGIRLNVMAFQIGFLLGPAIGGGLLVLLGPGKGMLVNTVTYLPLTVWLFLVPYTGPRQKDATAIQRVGLTQALGVLKEVSGNRTIVAMIALAGTSSLLVGNAFQVNMPEYAEDLGAGKSGIAYSALFAATAAGAFVGGLLLEGTNLLQPRARSAILCASLWCLTLVSFAAAPNYAIAFTLLIFAGVFNLTFSAMAQTLVQLQAPVNLRGRVMGLYGMSFGGLRVASGVTVGMMASLVGVQWSLGLSAAALLLVTFGLLAFQSLGVQQPRLSEA